MLRWFVLQRVLRTKHLQTSRRYVFRQRRLLRRRVQQQRLRIGVSKRRVRLSKRERLLLENVHERRLRNGDDVPSQRQRMQRAVRVLFGSVSRWHLQFRDVWPQRIRLQRPR